ncbi:uncharacterized protein BYT42DRAFT_581038 [Radiomyces spectabilis]|uniref:uncharacterized protein n=1 Tax=Radiomyces spectabilis TaxID=64574 RepID=UPI00221F9F21|nr:uncharacterized protein BYT42DRAFT_581038 [Radiomyces spectabilis]KAI8371665.1 hypothetical protein BYT42DRAFT_581038 [Radiomyces spectabilis]
MLTKTLQTSIHLLEPVLYLESSQDTPTVLRGVVNLDLKKSRAIESLDVYFDGQLETQWIGSDSKCEQRRTNIAHQRIDLLRDTPGSASALVLNSGKTRFGFEMELPEGLPETVECPNIRVHYQVSAVVTFVNNRRILQTGKAPVKKTVQRSKTFVRLARLPFEDILLGENYRALIDSRKHLSKWFQYHIIIDKKAVALGTWLPVTVGLAPTVPGLRIMHFCLQVIERRSVCPDKWHTIQTCHMLQRACSTDPQIPNCDLDEPWQGTIHYKVPDDRSLAHSTQRYSGFRVSHMLLISIMISFPEKGALSLTKRGQRTITFQTDIDLLDRSVGVLERNNAIILPSYDGPSPFTVRDMLFGNPDTSGIFPPAYHEIA